MAVDLIELSGDGKWLYFSNLLGPMLRRVPTAARRAVAGLPTEGRLRDPT